MKQHYSKPLLNRIELVTDQAVLTNCKVFAIVPGPTGGGDCQIGDGQQCQALGS
jgi:hypothetical protein